MNTTQGDQAIRSIVALGIIIKIWDLKIQIQKSGYPKNSVVSAEVVKVLRYIERNNMIVVADKRSMVHSWYILLTFRVGDACTKMFVLNIL